MSAPTASTTRPCPPVVPAPHYPPMPGVPPRAVWQGRRPPGQWSTPRLLQLLLGLIAVGAALMLAASIFAIGYLRQSVQSIGKDAVPSVLAAQAMRADLAQMDANAAIDLLTGSAANSPAQADFDAQRQDLANQIVIASKNITYGAAEQTPITMIANQTNTYVALIAQAQDRKRQNPNDPQVLALYRQATTLLHGTLLPATDALDKVNTDQLNQTYSGYQRAEMIVEALVILAGAVALVALVWTQVFLARRTRRFFNLPLLGASLIMLIALIGITGVFSAERIDLKGIKADSFDSLGVLSRARSTVLDMRGDEARMLLDPMNAATYDAAYRANFNLVIRNHPDGAALAITDPLIRQTDATVRDSRDAARVTFDGYLGDEFRNITFTLPDYRFLTMIGEKEAAMRALRAAQGFQLSDAQLRQLVSSGRQADATAYLTGMQATTTTNAFVDSFGGLTTPRDSLLNINDNAFNYFVGRGFADVNGLEWKLSAAMIVVLALAFWGMRPRMREYAV